MQKVSDGYIRHVVSVTSMSKDLSEIELIASKLKREKVNETLSKSVYAGCVVNLKDLDGTVVKDHEGNPLKYQVIAVYTKQARVKLVTDYGEEIGMYNIDDVIITDEDPLFKMEDYSIGDSVVWAEYDDVYEGKVVSLHTSMAEIGDIRKLYSVDFRRKLPYYKLHAKYKEDKSSKILTTIKDIISSEGEG